MADLTVQTLTLGSQGVSPGTALNYQSWADNDFFVNNGKTRLFIKGAASATGQVIIDSIDTCPFFGVAETPCKTNPGDLNGTTKRVVLGPFPTAWVNNLTTGKAQLTSTGTVSNVTIAPVSDPNWIPN